tara:strand:+ start:13271 stop:13417 length:147 start_codon:yes stop_codon:yes gene_type:complete
MQWSLGSVYTVKAKTKETLAKNTTIVRKDRKPVRPEDQKYPPISGAVH